LAGSRLLHISLHLHKCFTDNLSIIFESSKGILSLLSKLSWMKLTEAKKQFISSWGAFGTHWGINRTMAQIHALLMVSADPLTQDDVMQQLGVSRGNVNMNMRELISWGLVDRVIVAGERKEYFTAEKDTWKVATKVIRERKKRELDPMLKLLGQLEHIDGDKKDRNVKQFVETVSGIRKFGKQADKMLDMMVKADESLFMGGLLKIFK
jgi:DNA-binding transcriptional regulator GbsR (MarR family)